MESQLAILSESLDKKLCVLKEIEAYNIEQERLFTSGDPELDLFDEAVEKKGELIDRLIQLDEGFETFYARLADELKDKRARYAEQIKEMQEKIRQVTELGMTIQAQEARNKKLVEQYFSRQREGIRQSRNSSKAALNYYKSMNGNNYTEPRYMDSKQ